MSGSSILGDPAQVTVTEASLEEAITAIEQRAMEREESLHSDIMAAVEARFTAVEARFTAFFTAFEERAKARQDSRHAEVLAAIKRYGTRSPAVSLPTVALLSCSAQARLAARSFGV